MQLQCYFCWWRGVQCWHSPPTPPTRFPGVLVLVCFYERVCFRKWCSTSLCKFILDIAETKISSLKRVRQPFSCHAPCLPCVHCMCRLVEHVHVLINIFTGRIEECASSYWEETHLHAVTSIDGLKPTGGWFHINECTLDVLVFYFSLKRTSVLMRYFVDD